MTNPVWNWAAEHSLDSWGLTRAFRGPPSNEAGPCWSFSRYGRTETILLDGRVIRIGGQHEDWYDPDFYIYNDVIVTDAYGNTEIYGYPDDVFPPTDFHTATLVNDRIVMIGSLSYSKFRKRNAQVMLLDTDSYAIERLEITGDSPLWLNKHSAHLLEDGSAIVVRGGFIADDRLPIMIENIDDWRLDLRLGEWQRLTSPQWLRFAFIRADRCDNHLSYLRHFMIHKIRGGENDAKEHRRKFLADLGDEPRTDLLEGLYEPVTANRRLPKFENDDSDARYSIEGVTVRYVEDRRGVQLIIEGAISERSVQQLCSDLQSKLELIENSKIDCMRIDPA